MGVAPNGESGYEQEHHSTSMPLGGHAPAALRVSAALIAWHTPLGAFTLV
jgi:hypothetical protein